MKHSVVNDAPGQKLDSAHLITLTLAVDYAGIITIGNTNAGKRRIAPVSGGTFSGARLRGTVLPGADWYLTRPDGSLMIDVRLTLKLEEGILIYLAYEGLFKGEGDAMTRLSQGQSLKDHEYRVRTVVKFECGARSLQWLNDVLAVGVGRSTAGGAIYEIYEIL
jgi:uncharacterized protein DUF3237